MEHLKHKDVVGVNRRGEDGEESYSGGGVLHIESQVIRAVGEC